MPDALVSVIIPTYNRSVLLQRAVQSVLSQSYSNLEVLIIDDASTLDYSDVLKEFDDTRIRYIRHEQNKGPAASRNTGIRLAQGAYIAFNDDDDVWDNEKLEKQMHRMQASEDNVGLVFSKYKKILKDGSEKEILPANQDISHCHRLLLEYCFIGTPTVLIKRECIEKSGAFDENLPCLEDWDLWIRVSKYYSFAYIPENLVFAYESINSVNINKENNALALEAILNKYIDEISLDKKLLSLYYWRIGVAKGEIHDFKKSLLFLSKSALYDFRLSTTFRICLIVLKLYKIMR
ncbi:glycosyltransferase family 2 protein [Candidatus Kuenenia sp.]|uniref:glycosyltransferase family 2 protein n=1 Tax=Candidatus Kuenenia sp. TaxID=2499824 RepID=UPI00321FFC8C